MKAFLVFSLLVMFFFFVPLVHAQESIKTFDVTLTAHKDGVMSIEEDIGYNFGDVDRHGIFRTLPLVSKVGDLYRVISIDFKDIERDGKSEQYSLDKSAKETTVKIGDPDRTITGAHNYTIKYDVSNGVGSNYEDHDEIFWNATGNSWEVPIESATFTINTDFGLNPGNTICFTGEQGSKDANCKVEDTSTGKKITLTTSLGENEGLTVVSSFPVGTFPKSELQKSEPFADPDFISFLKFWIPVALILNFIIAPLIVVWYFKTKHKKRFGAPSVNFDLPEYPKGKRISPAEAGTIDNTKLDKDDIIATIFDLAIRKFITIEEVKKKGSFLGIGGSKDYQLNKLKEFTDLNDFEEILTDAIFGKKDKVLLKDTNLGFSDFDDLEKANFASLIKRGFYTKNPKSQMKTLQVFGILSLFTLNIILGPVLIWLSRKMNGRTDIGDEIDWKIDGLKLFLKNMSREYKWQAENEYFVEKYIPYAMSLGFIDEYMAQLKILNPDYKPGWYNGSGNFYAFYPYFGSSFNNNITTVAPSSSSGFSGGGFSGGGGGGGGGGSW